MGLFNYLKNKFSKKDEVKEEVTSPVEEEKKEEEITEKYVRGLKKSNRGFMYKLKSLTTAFRKVNDEYFDELEEI